MKKREYKIEIKATFGSKFQETTAVNALVLVLDSWVNFFSNKHVGTKLKYRLFTKD